MASGFLHEKTGSFALAITPSWKCACIAPYLHGWYPFWNSLHDHVMSNVDMGAFWSCPLEVSLYMVERGFCSVLWSWRMADYLLCYIQLGMEFRVCSFTLNRGLHCRFWGAQEFVQWYCCKSIQLSVKPRCLYDTRGFGCNAHWRVTSPKKLFWLCYISEISYFWYRFSKVIGQGPGPFVQFSRGILFVFVLVLTCSLHFDIPNKHDGDFVKACLARINSASAYFKLLLFDVWSGHIPGQCRLKWFMCVHMPHIWSLVCDLVMVGSVVLTTYAQKGNQESPMYLTEIAPRKGLSQSLSDKGNYYLWAMFALALCWWFSAWHVLGASFIQDVYYPSDSGLK